MNLGQRGAWGACLVLIACGSDVAATDSSCLDLAVCGGACVDTRYDPSHCGGCGLACAEGEVCELGTCIACPLGLVPCGGRCIDTLRDERHCGDCGAACATGEVCSMGGCALACGGGTTECAGRCVDTKVDFENCGTCGQTCNPGEICAVGECALECLAATTPCGGLCVDTSSDPSHCGGCDVACDTGEACADGSCEVSFTEMTVTLAAVQRGFWEDGGNHTASNNATYTGHPESVCCFQWIHNSYFIFDLASVTGLVVGARLRLELADYSSPDVSEPLSVWDVSTNASFLELGDADVSVFADLMSGTTYGTFTVSSLDLGQVKELQLNAAALGHIQAALGGSFAVGVHADDVQSLTYWEAVRFSNISETRIHELVITTLQ